MTFLETDAENHSGSRPLRCAVRVNDDRECSSTSAKRQMKSPLVIEVCDYRHKHQTDHALPYE